ncbi:hypothetical protein QJQ45_027743, partial [Haematococcus lacustris]
MNRNATQTLGRLITQASSSQAHDVVSASITCLRSLGITHASELSCKGNTHIITGSMLTSQYGKKVKQKHIIALNKLAAMAAQPSCPDATATRAIRDSRNTSLDLPPDQRKITTWAAGLTELAPTPAVPDTRTRYMDMKAYAVIHATQPATADRAAAPPAAHEATRTSSRLLKREQRATQSAPTKPNPPKAGTKRNNEGRQTQTIPQDVVRIVGLDLPGLSSWKVDKACRCKPKNLGCILGAMYGHQEAITSIDGWQWDGINKENYYKVHWKPTVIDRWALPLCAEEGYTPTHIEPISREEAKDVCTCELCWLPRGDSPTCHNCKRAYHPACLEEAHLSGHKEPGYWLCPICKFGSNDFKTTMRQSAHSDLIRVHWHPTFEPAPLITAHLDYMAKRSVYNEENRQIQEARHARPDTHLPAHTRQGLPDPHTWLPRCTNLHSKATFHTYPINPQTDIIGTGKCETFLQLHPHMTTPAMSLSTGEPIMPQHDLVQHVTVHDESGRTIGLLTKDQHQHLHAWLQHTPHTRNLATEVAALLRRQDTQSNHHPMRVAQDRALTTLHTTRSFTSTVQRWADPLTVRPETTTYWSPDINDTAFGAHHNCLLVRHTGLSTWNVPADDAVALKCVNHAIHSATQEEAMATIMLIPGKKGISYPKHIDTLRRYPEYCQHLASIPPTKTSCTKSGKHATLHIYVIWNAAGQQLVTKGKPQAWLASTATALHPQRDTHPIHNRPTNQSQPATPPSGHKQHMCKVRTSGRDCRFASSGLSRECEPSRDAGYTCSVRFGRLKTSDIAFARALQVDGKDVLVDIGLDQFDSPSTPKSPHFCGSWSRPALNALLDEYADVFAPITSLPPERPVGHAIPLVPDARPSVVPQYRMSQEEHAELKKQVQDLLAKGMIEPSSSPFAAPILFVKKKSGELRMCLDYRQLNKITIRDQYPLPRIDDLFDKLSGCTVFSSLDLQAGYNQIRITPEDVPKTAFRTPDGHYQFKVLSFGLCNAPATFQRVMNDAFAPVLNQCALVYLDDILVMSKSVDEHLKHLRKVFDLLRLNKLFAKQSKCEFMRVGAVLMQDGYPLAYLSKKLSSAERNYTTGEQELLALITACKEWRCYLEGVPFTLFTDHKPLTALPTQKVLSRRQARWMEFLSRFTFDLQYLPGYANPADPLSRIPAGPQDCAMVCVVTTRRQAKQSLERGEVRVAQALPQVPPVGTPSNAPTAVDALAPRPTVSDNPVAAHHSRLPELEAPSAADTSVHYPAAPAHPLELADHLVHGYRLDPAFTAEADLSGMYMDDHGLWRRTGKGTVMVPNDPELREYILHEMHDAAYAGHVGITKTLERLSRVFYWDTMRSDVRHYVTTCDACQRDKSSTLKPGGLLNPLSIPDYRWESVSMDLITKLPSASHGFDAICVFVDRLSKMVHFVPCKESMNAKGFARLFVDNVFKLHGLPKDMVSDRGPHFHNTFWHHVQKLLGMRGSLSSSYHPQSDGQTERYNRVLEEMLRHYISPTQADWPDYLSLAEFAVNNSWQESIKSTPFLVNTGQSPITPMLHSLPDKGRCPEGLSYATWWQEAVAKAKLCMQAAQQRQAAYANQDRREVHYKVGQMVLLSTKNMRLKPGKARKLLPRFVGPFKVLGLVGQVAVSLQLPASMSRLHPVFHVSLIKPYTGTDVGFMPPPVEWLDEEPVYYVERLLDHRHVHAGKAKEYLVQWEGYDADHNTWEPRSNLVGCDKILAEYNAAHNLNSAGSSRLQVCCSACAAAAGCSACVTVHEQQQQQVVVHEQQCKDSSSSGWAATAGCRLHVMSHHMSCHMPMCCLLHMWHEAVMSYQDKTLSLACDKGEPVVLPCPSAGVSESGQSAVSNPASFLVNALRAKPPLASAKVAARWLRKGGTGVLALITVDNSSTPDPAPAEPDLPPGVSQALNALLDEYADVFAPITSLPPERPVGHAIPLVPDARPSVVPQYRMSQEEHAELKKQVQDLLAKGMIEPSSSPFAAPILFVKKKSDLQAGYNQIRITPEDVPKTAFRTPDGHYQFKVLSFGLCNAPATFQRVMNDAFAPVLNQCALVYLDDILVMSKSVDEHLKHLRKVFDLLRLNKLFAKQSKCEFMRVGAVLMQDGYPLAYLSKKLSSAERNYTTGEQELLALITACKEWRLPELEAPSAADTSVHYPAAPAHPLELADHLVHGYRLDPAFTAEADLSGMYMDDHGLWRRTGKGTVMVPNDPELRDYVLHEMHDAAYAGHVGITKTLERLSRVFYWDTMRSDVRHYVTTCDACQRDKSSTLKPGGLLNPLSIPDYRWESVSMDLITKLPSASHGFDAICVFVDRLSKMVHFVPCKESMNAKGFARLFVDNVFKLHGLPKDMVSDRGPHFHNTFWHHVQKLLGMRGSLSSSYHPQSDGQTERYNRVLEEMLRHYISPTQADWPDYLSLAEFAVNNSWQESIKSTPFLVNTGQSPITPMLHSLPDKGRCPEGLSYATWWQEAVAKAKLCMQAAQQRQAAYANQDRREVHYKVGQMVLLSTKNMRLKPGKARKLLPRFVGPFKVLGLVGQVVVSLQLPASMSRLHPVFHVSLIKPYTGTDVGFMPPPVEWLDEEPVYYVERLLDHRHVHAGKAKEYLVQWEGYDADHNTWEPRSNLVGCDKILAEYNAAHNLKDLPTAGHQRSHQQLTQHSTTQPRMAITEWATLAYSDGSCIKTSGAAPASVGAGVYIPETNVLITVALDDPESNTINKAELTAIHAALTAGAKRIATDSLCSIYQIRRALANPMSLITHRHNDILTAIATLIIDSPVTIHFYKVRAHSGIIGNEGADALAKHAALHPELANTPAYHPTTRKETNTWLSNEADGEIPAPLPDCRQSVRAHMHRKHKLGLANQDSIYYLMSQEITKVAAPGAGERVMTDAHISTHAQRTALLYRTGGLYNQKLALRWKRATDDRCPICGEADSATHLLSGCSETLPLVQERHNGAGRLIVKAISKGTLGGYIRFADTGSWEKGAKENLDLPNDTLHTTLRALGLKTAATKNTTRPDILMVTPQAKAGKSGKVTKRVTIIEIKYCSDS